MNPFVLSYIERLKAWHDLKNELESSDLGNICVEVDRFWQKCPMSNHYLHPDEIETWPDPWQLLNDNIYCPYARALGMVYTLLLLGIEDIDFIEATDYHNNDVVLVLVDCVKYVMNYWPGSVLNTTHSDFEIKRHIDVDPLFKKINIKNNFED